MIVDYISLMRNNMCPYAIMVGEKYIQFIAHHYKFIENDKMNERTLINGTNNNLDPFLYHLGESDVDSFKTLERSPIHICWPHDDDEDENVVLVVENEDDVLVEHAIETKYYNENNKVVKIFEQNCVIC